MRNDECLAFVHAIVLTNNGGPLHESYPPEGMIFLISVIIFNYFSLISSVKVEEG